MGILYVIEALERGETSPTLLHDAAKLLRASLQHPPATPDPLPLDPTPLDQSVILRGIVEQAPIAIAFLDPQLRCAHVNTAFASIFRRRPDDLVGRSLEHIVAHLAGPNLAAEYLAHCNHALQTGQTIGVRGSPLSSLADPDKPRFYDWDVRRIDRSNDVPIGLLVTMADVTLHELARCQLAQSEERFRLVAEAVPDILFIGQFIGQRGASCRFISSRWYEYTGMPPASAEGLGWTAALHPDDVKRHEQALHLACTANQPYNLQLRLRGADASYRWFVVHTHPTYDAQGHRAEVFGVCTDIDDLKRAQHALLASEARNFALLRALPDLLFRLDHNGVFLDYVTGTERNLFMPPEHFLGKPVDAVLPAPIGRQVQDLIQQAIQTQQMQTIEYTLSIHGHPQHFEARIISASTNEVLAIVRDVTAHKLAQQALLENEEQLRLAKEAAEAASKAKDQFLAVLSHELRTPLTPVLLSVSTIEQDPSLPLHLRDQLAMIHSHVQLEARLIDDLLDLTAISRGTLQLQLQTVDAHDLLLQSHRIVQPDALAKHLTLTLDLAASHCHVRADPVRLQQVFWNILKNAVKFTPENGHVTIRSRNEPQPSNTPPSSQQPPLIIEITDSGIGIQPDLLPRIFHAFEQGDANISRRFGGLGLGLSISNALINMLAGSLSARSQGKDTGSTFTLRLPTVCPPPVRVPPPTPNHPTVLHALRILLVEDHDQTATLLARLLQTLDYDVQVAGTVHNALQLAQATPFDLLISDIGLPDGTGIDLIQQLNHHRPHNAIAISGFGMEQDIADSRNAGFDLHLTKPITLQQLLSAIESLIPDRT